MSIKAEGKPAKTKTNCRVCWELINPKALKCTKCGSYQDWTRHFMRWSAILVSVFALATLWSISKSLTQLAAGEKKAAKIEAALTACELREVRVLYENSGEISGFVTGAHFSLLLDGAHSSSALTIRRSDGQEDIVVDPKERPVRAVYKAYIDNTETSFVSKPLPAKSCSYIMEFDWMDFAGTKRQLHRECPCP